MQKINIVNKSVGGNFTNHPRNSKNTLMKSNEIELNVTAKPFLRWAGGKRWLIKHIGSINSQKINNYYEPFLGGGSVFFNLTNFKNANLSDLNSDLIDTYTSLKTNVELVIKKLRTFKNTEDFYYKIRETSFENIYENAAKFIYLNKTSFNGIYRVNHNGKFNVPYGFRNKNIDIVDAINLIRVSKKLQNAIIKCQDFEQTLSSVKKGDLVFLDPPYTVAHENNGFIQYNQKIFSIDDQKRLSAFVEMIKKKNAFYILTNAKHKAILEIYKNIDKPIVLTRSSTVGGIGARREDFNEYIFTNFLV